MKTYAKGQSQLEIGVLGVVQNAVHLVFRHMQPLLRVILSREVRYQIQRSQSRLSARRDKNQRRTQRRVLPDGLEGWSVHGRHSRAIVLPRKAADVHFQGHGSHRWSEIVQAHLRRSKRD